MRRFNPWRQFHGAFVPEWLMRSREVSPGAKLCYARLCRYAGAKGVAFPEQAELAEELAVDVRTVQRYVKELVELGLIEVEQRGMGLPNRYFFLDHPMIRGEEEGTSDTTDLSGLDTTDVATQDTTDVSPPSMPLESAESESFSRASRRDVTKPSRTRSKRRAEVDSDADLDRTGSLPDDEEPEALPAPRRRPTRWSVKSLVEEFSFLALGCTTVPASARDTNRGALGKTIKKWVEQGTTTYDDVAEAMDVFFTVPESRLRTDSTLWLSFVNSYSEIALRHGNTTRITTSAHKKEPAQMTKEEYSAYVRSRGGRL